MKEAWRANLNGDKRIIKPWKMSIFIHFFTPCKVIHDSLGIRIPWCGLRIPRTGFKIPPRWVPNSKKSLFRDSGFLDMDSEFQRVGFRIPQSNIFRIPDSTSKCFLDSGIRITLHGADFCMLVPFLKPIQITLNRDISFNINSNKY